MKVLALKSPLRKVVTLKEPTFHNTNNLALIEDISAYILQTIAENSMLFSLLILLLFKEKQDDNDMPNYYRYMHEINRLSSSHLSHFSSNLTLYSTSHNEEMGEKSDTQNNVSSKDVIISAIMEMRNLINSDETQKNKIKTAPPEARAERAYKTVLHYNGDKLKDENTLDLIMNYLNFSTSQRDKLLENLITLRAKNLLSIQDSSTKK